MQEVEVPRISRQLALESDKVVSPISRSSLYPRVEPRVIGEKFQWHNHNRTRDLPALIAVPQPTALPRATCFTRKEFTPKCYCGRRRAQCTVALSVRNALANWVSALLQASEIVKDEKCGGCEQCDRGIKLSACVCTASIQYLILLPFTAWPKH